VKRGQDLKRLVKNPKSRFRRTVSFFANSFPAISTDFFSAAFVAKHFPGALYPFIFVFPPAEIQACALLWLTKFPVTPFGPHFR